MAIKKSSSQHRYMLYFPVVFAIHYISNKNSLYFQVVTRPTAMATTHQARVPVLRVRVPAAISTPVREPAAGPTRPGPAAPGPAGPRGQAPTAEWARPTAPPLQPTALGTEARGRATRPPARRRARRPVSSSRHTPNLLTIQISIR